ncbi:hypothetical protein [Herpetosiphon gulosus]|uniref:Uncharacterized protein n=1 Tax=Herpetosiphon gulosus TaxID=1973496 RepID=A0ABP9X1F3_9CHLR
MRQRRWVISLFTIVLVGCSNVQASNITPSVIPLPTATPEPSVKPLPSVTPEPSVKPLPLETTLPIVPTAVPLATATQIEPPTVVLPTLELATATTAMPSADQLPLEACQQAVQTEATQYNISKFSPDLMRVTPINPNTWELVSTATVSFDNPNSATFELLWLCEVMLDANQQWSINKVYYTSQW